MGRLLQQGTQRIEIIVRKDAGISPKGTNEIDVDNAGSPADNANDKKDDGKKGLSRRAKTLLRVNATHMLGAMKQGAILGISYNINSLASMHGDQAMQDRVNRQVEIAEDYINVGSAVMMGITFGASGGPIGMLMGGAIGAITSIMPVVSKYANREREYDFKLFKENNAIEYKRARAGINLTTGRRLR